MWEQKKDIEALQTSYTPYYVGIRQLLRQMPWTFAEDNLSSGKQSPGPRGTRLEWVSEPSAGDGHILGSVVADSLRMRPLFGLGCHCSRSTRQQTSRQRLAASATHTAKDEFGSSITTASSFL